MNENALISIIVPCYNVEQYLPKCIDSIINQTYRNMEIILVDDGSPDRCGEICDAYAKKDERIRVIHKENGGLSDARNVAIDVAKGKYLTFVDSDDWIHEQYIEVLYDILAMTGADISMCAFLSTMERHVRETDIVTRTVETMSGVEAIERTLYQDSLYSSSWGKLYKKEIFDDLRYTVGRLYEDLDLFYKIYERAHLVVHSKKTLYYYYSRENSILGIFTPTRLVVLDITDEIVKYMEERHPEIVKAALDRKMSANFNMLALMTKHKTDNDQAKRRCWDNIRQLRWGRLLDPKVRLKNKLGIIVSLLGQRILKCFFRYLG